MRTPPANPRCYGVTFRNSLLAAYSLGEVRQQLIATGLGGLLTEQVSNRHLIVWGTM